MFGAIDFGIDSGATVSGIALFAGPGDDGADLALGVDFPDGVSVAGGDVDGSIGSVTGGAG